jgi:hypothetical protein
MFPYLVILVIANIFTYVETSNLIENNHKGFTQKFYEKDISPFHLDKTQTKALIENWLKMTQIKTVLRKLFSEEIVKKKKLRKFSFTANRSKFHQWPLNQAEKLVKKCL